MCLVVCLLIIQSFACLHIFYLFSYLLAHFTALYFTLLHFT